MLFLDSSDPREVDAIFGWGVVSGVTTNPLLLARSGVDDVEEHIAVLLEKSTGPFSVELLAEDEAAMLAEADRYAALSPERIVIKVAFGETGLVVTRRLLLAGRRVNLTACMSFNQAYVGALAGAMFVSIFSGRVRDMGYDVRPVIAATRKQIDREGLGAKIIVGSIRHLSDVNEALEAGAHIVTVSPDVLKKMLKNPQTDETIREFNSAWRDRETKRE